MREREIVELLKAHAGAHRKDVVLGIGDDAAVVRADGGDEIVLCTDTLVAGVHFPFETDAESIGHKSLAVNLSDIAAMGAEPRWALLALTVPDADDGWLSAFARGFHALAERYDVQLTGGDLTRGPLSITVQLVGTVPAGTAIRRSGARPGDRLFVSGTLGDAALALQMIRDTVPVPAALRDRLDRPEPRVSLGRALRGRATAAMDLSDGLLVDIGRMATASGVGATLWLDALPASAAFREHGGTAAQQLAGGDDYELLFAMSPDGAVEDGWTEIGQIEPPGPVRVIDAAGDAVEAANGGYEHFN